MNDLNGTFTNRHVETGQDRPSVFDVLSVMPTLNIVHMRQFRNPRQLLRL